MRDTSLFLLLICFGSIFLRSTANQDDDIILGAKVLETVASGFAMAVPVFGPIAVPFIAIGAIVRDIGEHTKPSPVQGALTQLSYKLTDISRKIDASTAALGDLIVGHSFKTDVVYKVERLMTLMTENLATQSRVTKDAFLNECTYRYPPYNLILEICNRLSDPHTNPLTKAMEGDPLRTRKTFDTWRNTITGLWTKLKLLQFYFIGMQYTDPAEVQTARNLLEARIKLVESNFYKFCTEYRAPYWPEAVRILVEATQDNSVLSSNEKIAEHIRDQLKKVYTDDWFYVIVYNDIRGFDKHCYRSHLNKTVESFSRGGSNIVVYRSHTANDRYLNDKSNPIAKFESKMAESIKKSFWTVKQYSSLLPSVEKLYKVALVNDGGFVAVIGDYNVAIKSTGKREMGPGFWSGWYRNVIIERDSALHADYQERRAVFTIAGLF